MEEASGMLGGTQSLSEHFGEVINLLHLFGFEPYTIQHVA
jgi:hypothetical protein